MSNNINLFADIWGINIRQKTKQIRNYNKVNYEWDIETIDKDGDNQDNPKYLKKILKFIKSDFDLIMGRRTIRKHSVYMILLTYLYDYFYAPTRRAFGVLTFIKLYQLVSTGDLNFSLYG